MTRPSVSIVLEGYNESRELGAVASTLDALAQQDGCPLDEVEIVLVGSREQVDAWKGAYESGHPFFDVRPVPVADAAYYELKNVGADAARGGIVVFTDSDVFPRPRWLASILAGIAEGADVTAGLTLFKSADSWDPTPASRLVAASISWGWVVGRDGRGSRPEAVGFMDHNVAVRGEVVRDHPYRTDYARLLGGPLKFRSFVDAGRTVRLQPGQQVVHSFSWPWWLGKLHFRYGYEVYMLRRLDHGYPNQWISRTSVLEPAVTMVWHMLLDGPRWLRVSGLLGLPVWRRVALLPLVAALSTVARGAEMAGMYCTMAAPKRMRRWTQQV